MHDPFLKSFFADRRIVGILIRDHVLPITTYTALALEGIATGPDFGPGDALPEFVYLVLYHGDGPWSGPDRVADLFQRSDPGRFRLVSWREGAGTGRPLDDITALVLGVARSHGPEDMAEQVAALRLRVAELGDASLERIRGRATGDAVRIVGRRARQWSCVG